MSTEASTAASEAHVQPGSQGRLSPSRASDFTTCPLLYRFRSVDRLPEPPTRATAKGTLVHLVLERLFEQPAQERTVSHAVDLISLAWNSLVEEDEGYRALVAESELASWFDEASTLVHRYFQLEDPQQVNTTHRESPVQCEITPELVLRGLVDRIDTDADGGIVVVDYKTGKSPSPQFEEKAMFQMRFYALVLWKSTGVIASRLRLIYLGDGQILEYRPEERDLLATQRRLLALWDAIKTAHAKGEFRPRPSVLCGWCHFKPLCPAHGGDAPPLPR